MQLFTISRLTGSQHFCNAVNSMDRSCAATIYPVLDKPRTTGVFQDRRKIGALLGLSSTFA